MWKTLLRVTTILVVLAGLPIVGLFAGLAIGDRMCDDAYEELFEFRCLEATVNGGLIGFGAGLCASIVLATVLVVRYRGRRKPEVEPGR